MRDAEEVSWPVASWDVVLNSPGDAAEVNSSVRGGPLIRCLCHELARCYGPISFFVSVPCIEPLITSGYNTASFANYSWKSVLSHIFLQPIAFCTVSGLENSQSLRRFTEFHGHWSS